MKRRAPGLGRALIERPAAVEASLWRRLQTEPALREALFERHLPFARAVAAREFRRRPSYGLERSDFEQLAMQGLLEAIDRYDPLRGPPFEAFARPRIRGAISDDVSRSSESAAQFRHRQRIERERLRSIEAEATAGDAGADPLAALTDLATSLAIGLIAENAWGFLQDIADSSLPANGYESLAWRELELSVVQEIERLPSAERSVLQQHYFNGVAFTEIARMMGLSKGRISQLHRAALAHVRARLRHIAEDE